MHQVFIHLDNYRMPFVRQFTEHFQITSEAHVSASGGRLVFGVLSRVANPAQMAALVFIMVVAFVYSA